MRIHFDFARGKQDWPSIKSMKSDSAGHSWPLQAHVPGPSAQVRLNDYCDSLALRHWNESIAVSEMMQKVQYLISSSHPIFHVN